MNEEKELPHSDLIRRRKLEWKRLQSNEEYFEEEEVVTGQMPF